EGRLEVAEPASIEGGGAAQRRGRSGAADPHLEANLSGDSGGIPLQQSVDVVQVEPEDPQRQRSFGGAGDPATHLDQAGAVFGTQSEGTDRGGQVAQGHGKALVQTVAMDWEG